MNINEDIYNKFRDNFLSKGPGICILRKRKYKEKIKYYSLFAKKDTLPYNNIILHNNITFDDKHFILFIDDNFESVGMIHYLPIDKSFTQNI